MRKTLLILLGAIVLTAAGVGLYIWLSGGDAGNLVVEVTAPERVQVGVPFDLIISMDNASNQELRDAQLTISLPADIVLTTTSSNKTIENKKLGAVPPGKLLQETVTAVAISGENTVKSIKVSVSYLPGSISSRFEQTATTDIVIVESGMFTDIKTPTKVLGGEDFTIELTYRNISEKDFSNVELRLATPPTFVLKSASVPQSATGLWRIGSVPKGVEGKITVAGSLMGQDDAVFEFRLKASASIGNKSYPISEKQASISLSPSPLSLRLTMSGASGQNGVVLAGDYLTYTLRYANTTDVALKDVVIHAKLTGEMFDTNTLSTNASFRSQDNLLTWNASQVAGLASIEPARSGQVSFSLRAKSSQPIIRLSSKNFVLKVAADIESPTVPRFVAGSKVTGFAEIETKVRGQFMLATEGYYRDSSGFTNTGLPPKVGKKTTYTIHWVLKNTSTDITGITMRAFLGPNVRFTGNSKSTTGVLPVYNERTQEMTWSVDSLPATKGILSPATEAIFQVEIIPSVDQANSDPILIQETTATGKDTFTDSLLTVRSPAVTTAVTADQTVSSNDKIVRN